MQAIKKVEIIIDYLELPRLLELIQKEDMAVGYTVIKEAVGSGGRGDRTGDGFSGELTNSYILIACSEDEAQSIVEIVRPVLKRFGGVCLVSDAMWVKH
ncbi:MAG: transcriptional regulator [Sulfuriferula multivorans]|uniref:Transcriptional regulator n=1 Tax=Sulfuriferula multivorans TaxID=1559896 RepID=A0A7C9KB21_9PROT|nr:transcriptional regulator [Sulfuriferula multivorans]